MLDFVAMVTDDGVPMEAVAAYLDGLPPAARREAAHALRRKEQRALYRKALASKGLTLADFVPADRAALTAVRQPIVDAMAKALCGAMAVVAMAVALTMAVPAVGSEAAINSDHGGVEPPHPGPPPASTSPRWSAG